MDIIPLQLAAERTARVRGEDCDAFRFVLHYLDEGGLIEKKRLISFLDECHILFAWLSFLPSE